MATKQNMEAREADLKRDIQESENRLEVKLKELEITLRKDIEVLRAEMKRDIAETGRSIAETKAEPIRWVVGVGILQLTIITALKLVNKK